MLLRLLALALCLAPLHAGVVRIDLSERSDVLNGKSFGDAGPYERMIGKAYFAIDPKLPANRIIADIDLAPRNEQGLVEFSADIYVLKPRDPQRGNRAVLYEVSNRGGKGMLSFFNRGAAGSPDPRTEAHFGDGFLLAQGYTLIWLGWQTDTPVRDGLMRLESPVATLKGQPLTGPVRSEFIPETRVTRFPLGDRGSHVPYRPANPNDPAATLTVRDTALGQRRVVPRESWSFEDDSEVVSKQGFDPGKIYELVYTAVDPKLVGLGPAAIRDLMSFLKFGGAHATSALGDQSNFLRRAYGFGISQSGRFLRTFLYYGFNGDERGRRVFDGVLAHVAGGGRGSFNHRFAQPSRDGHPFLNFFYPTDIFPFTDLPETDPESGFTDAILARARAAGVAPKIMYTNSSYEYWGRSAGLIHASPDGKSDAPLPDDTRVYLFAGGQHGPAAFPPVKTKGQHASNPNDYRWPMRALLLAMNNWVANDIQPPASRYPKVSEDKLVTPGAVQFPKIPGVSLPTRPQVAYRADYGPEFASKGIVAKEPPALGKAFPVLVPQVDRDGNETSGIRMPWVEAPLATFTGWNLLDPKSGPPEEAFNMVGSWIPFAKTKAARGADPRPSIEERYPDRDAYRVQLEAAAKKLAGAGYLLESDLPGVIAQGMAQWDYLAARN